MHTLYTDLPGELTYLVLVAMILGLPPSTALSGPNKSSGVPE